jgi:hypothetical protein
VRRLYPANRPLAPPGMGGYNEGTPTSYSWHCSTTLPREDSAIVAVLRAYFDESDRSETGGAKVFSVAGVVFKPNKAVGFARAWRKMLGPFRCFHTADLLAHKGEFRELTRADSDTMLRQAVSIVNRYRAAVVTCSCNVDDFEDLKRAKRFSGFNSPYSVCAHTCMVLLGNWLRKTGNPAKVAYLLEAGHRDSADSHGLLSRACGIKDLRDAYRYRSHAFLQKEDALHLQAADLLAWEHAKLQGETRQRLKREMRASYFALQNGDKTSFLAVHRDKNDLQQLMDELLLAWHVPEPTS